MLNANGLPDELDDSYICEWLDQAWVRDQLRFPDAADFDSSLGHTGRLVGFKNAADRDPQYERGGRGYAKIERGRENNLFARSR